MNLGSKEASPKRHARYQYNEQYSLERLANKNDHNAQMLESIKGLRNHAINSYTQVRQKDREELVKSRANRADSARREMAAMDQRQKPSALSLFPHLGMISNKETYTTVKNVEERDIKQFPQGYDDGMKQYYLARPNAIKDYKNEWLKAQQMLVNRKFKVSKKN